MPSWYKRILVAYDGSDASKRAVAIARDMMLSNQAAEVVFVHALVVCDSYLGDPQANQALLDNAQLANAALEEFASEFQGRSKTILLKGSNPACLLVKCARSEKCDTIVMGSRGNGGIKGYLGSVSTAVIRETDAVVVIAKECDD